MLALLLLPPLLLLLLLLRMLLLPVVVVMVLGLLQAHQAWPLPRLPSRVPSHRYPSPLGTSFSLWLVTWQPMLCRQLAAGQASSMQV